MVHQEQKASPSGAGDCPDVPIPEGESTDGEVYLYSILY